MALWQMDWLFTYWMKQPPMSELTHYIAQTKGMKIRGGGMSDRDAFIAQLQAVAPGTKKKLG